jgi:large subunit ribosomal protein L24
MSARIRKGDVVAVVTGDDKGKRGRVLAVLTEKNRVVIEGVNLVFKHLRKSQQNPQGGRVRREAAIHVSNVMPIDPTNDKPTRVSSKEVDGRRVRVARRSSTVLPADAGRRGRKGETPAAAKETS